MWMTSCTGSVCWGFWEICEKSVSWVPAWLRRELRLRPGRGQMNLCATGAACVGGGDEKVSIDRWYLSPYGEKPFNSKVIKSFVPELRSHKCFSCFGIPMFYVYMLWTFYVHFPYSCMAMVQKHILLLTG